MLQGNPDVTLNIIKNIRNKWKFSSGVMSFEELLDDKTKKEIIEEFKRVFFAGLEQDQYNLLIVEHTDKGRTELHFLIPRIELTTGRAFNPFWHKRDFAKKDLFQDYINAKYGLTSPHIAQKQQDISLNPKLPRNELKQQIDDYIRSMAEQGLIQSGEDTKYYLEQAGAKITRQGKNYIGIEIEDKKIRLKGVYYGTDFKSIRKLAENARERERKHIPASSSEFRDIKRKLDTTIRKQAEYNAKRYGRSDKQPTREFREHRLGAGAVQDKEKVEMGDRRIDNRDIDSNRDNISNNKNGRYTNRRKYNKKSTNLEVLRNDRIKKQTNRVVRAREERKRISDDRAGITINRVIRAGEARKRKREERATRYAKRTKQTNTGAKRVIEAGIRAVEELRRAINARKARFQRIRAIRRAFEDNVRRVKELAMQELEKFKQEVNIAEVAQLFGYYIDKEKSSRAVKQLRNDSTGDKIVVSRNKVNGHYIYFSMRDYKDNGTIIDFLQRHTGKNLGKVRVWLRKWLKNEIQGEYEQTSIVESRTERNKIARVWEKIKNTDLITDFRGINRAIWEEIIERDRVKVTDEAIYFKMLDLDGICGIEKRGFDGEKRIISGSEKGLWSFGNLKNAKEVVIAESPIDAISYKVLQGNNDDVYILATMGAMSRKQEEILKELANRAKDKKIIIATDADEAGERMAKQIADIFMQAGAVEIVRARPSRGKDWNEELEAVQKERRRKKKRGIGLGLGW